MDDIKRITVVAGHFGSGKTEFSINYALLLRKMGFDVTVIDFDIVNPYYRSKDAEALLNKNGIEVIAPEFANSNLETPTLPPDILKAFYDTSRYVIFDAGGDEDGATPLGVYNDYFRNEDYDMLFVLNKKRMLTNDIDGVKNVYNDIENASRLKFTGIVNNTHLMEYTDADIIAEGQEFAEIFSKTKNLPIRFTCVKQEYLTEKNINSLNISNRILPLKLFVGPRFYLDLL